jgi:glycosyltransferase involved in cell wall biosynthesis
MKHFVNVGHDVHLVTTFRATPQVKFKSLTHIPVAFSSLINTGASRGIKQAISGAGKIGLRTTLRHWFGPVTIPASARKLCEVVKTLKPELIHAMRIPFEGMLAAHTDLNPPLIVSVWGNDFTLHAPATPWMGRLTRSTLGRIAGLHVDCNRDLGLAHEYGFPADKPAVVLPGSGGILPEFFYPPENEIARKDLMIQGDELDIPADARVIVNPRGFRTYVRNDTFFKSIPIILDHFPNSIFLCPAMKDVGEAERWISRLGIEGAVRLLPKLSPGEMGDIFRRAQVSVSPSEHDGTPNTLLESMACGCFPISGDLESIREWVEHGSNGLLIDPSNPTHLANAVIDSFRQPELRERAREKNIELISTRAVRSTVMQRAESFYERFV